MFITQERKEAAAKAFKQYFALMKGEEIDEGDGVSSLGGGISIIGLGGEKLSLS